MSNDIDIQNILCELGHRECSLCLSPESSSFKWSIFSNRLFKALKDNEEYKGKIDINKTYILIPWLGNKLHIKNVGNKALVFVPATQKALCNIILVIACISKYTEIKNILNLLTDNINICSLVFFDDGWNHTTDSLRKLIEETDKEMSSRDIYSRNLVLTTGAKRGSMDEEMSEQKNVDEQKESYKNKKFNVVIMDGNQGLKNITELYQSNRYVVSQSCDSIRKNLEYAINRRSGLAMKMKLYYDFKDEDSNKKEKLKSDRVVQIMTQYVDSNFINKFFEYYKDKGHEGFTKYIEDSCKEILSKLEKE